MNGKGDVTSPRSCQPQHFPKCFSLTQLEVSWGTRNAGRHPQHHDNRKSSGFRGLNARYLGNKRWRTARGREGVKEGRRETRTVFPPFLPPSLPHSVQAGLLSTTTDAPHNKETAAGEAYRMGTARTATQAA
ncbi:hypothetical protein E2C01_084950 [Portunus trituberculatus]|uniref:Uncharacterized protein n=1 Tax=Portunus trituberculatus TaxID=210409 RepID=A0A5B7JC88_PORTR|nr:hypothetical protein [Portunus trituberculatus]